MYLWESEVAYFFPFFLLDQQIAYMLQKKLHEAFKV